MTNHETEQLRDLGARLTRFEAKINAVARHHEYKQLTGLQHKSGSWCRMVSYGVIRDIQIDGKQIYRGLLWQLTDHLDNQKERHQ
jgi:hypothetical protein